MPTDALAFIRKFRGMSEVTRYGKFRTIVHQTNADHTCHVTMMALLFLGDIEENLGFAVCIDRGWTWREVSLRAVFHDFPETFTGDIYGNIKDKYPKLRRILEEIESEEVAKFFLGSEFTEVGLFAPDAVPEDHLKEIYQMVKFCDILERYFFCEEELSLGNRRFMQHWERSRNTLTFLFPECVMLQNSPTAIALMETISKAEEPMI